MPRCCGVCRQSHSAAVRRLKRRNAMVAATRDKREVFLAAHCEVLYGELTQHYARFMRLEDLVFAAADALPGLTPTAAQVAAEAELLQRDKDGVEIDQGIFLAHVLASEQAGRHLCHAMLLPRPESAELLSKLDADGAVDLGAARVERRGKAIIVTASNPRFPQRGGQHDHRRHGDCGRRRCSRSGQQTLPCCAAARSSILSIGADAVGAGINLTHLYLGQIPFVWFLKRDLGFVHKFFRGVARPEAVPDDVHGTAIEKPWIAAVDGFAIGGHCQILLTMDYVLAASGAFMTLPARKEGIIPGAANLRMPRFTGDRITRQAIQYERKLVLR